MVSLNGRSAMTEHGTVLDIIRAGPDGVCFVALCFLTYIYPVIE